MTVPEAVLLLGLDAAVAAALDGMTGATTSCCATPITCSQPRLTMPPACVRDCPRVLLAGQPQLICWRGAKEQAMSRLKARRMLGSERWKRTWGTTSGTTFSGMTGMGSGAGASTRAPDTATAGAVGACIHHR